MRAVRAEGSRSLSLAEPIHRERAYYHAFAFGIVYVLIRATQRASPSFEASERERISRELHDRVAHHMGVAHQSLELHAALTKTAPDRAEVKLRLARENTRLALDQTRALSAELKRLQEEELGQGIEAAFRTLAESYVPDGVEVDLSFSGEGSAIPNPIGLQVYLAMREALRNAVKHSGCSRIGITLEVADGGSRQAGGGRRGGLRPRGDGQGHTLVGDRLEVHE